MAGRTEAVPGPSLRAVAMTAIGWAGLAACLTLMYLGMRSVMDVGGSCADGGPYVSAQPCPDGSTPALLLGIFGGFGFGFLASVGGIAVGGIWAATPILAWSALFGSLGWNFIQYGIVNPPGGELDWGWAICGILFWAMAFFPLIGVISMARAGVGRSRGRPRDLGGEVVRLGGPGQPARPPASPRPQTVRSVTTATVQRSVDVVRRRPAAEREQLEDIATDFGSVISATLASTPIDPEARPAPATPAEPDPEFTEGTQALLDRLERLADMRDRGLLGNDEYETAKAAIMTELEGRS
jgi:hypothetical protein